MLVRVEVFASGYFQSSKRYFLNKEDVPDENDFRKWQFHTWLYQPMAELERLAAAGFDPSQAWSNQATAAYVGWCEQNRAPYYEDFNPLSVRKIIPRPVLHGIIDSVRTRALLFALDVQGQFREYWLPRGPRVVRVRATSLDHESCRSEPRLVWLRATCKAPSTV